MNMKHVKETVAYLEAHGYKIVSVGNGGKHLFLVRDDGERFAMPSSPRQPEMMPRLKLKEFKMRDRRRVMEPPKTKA